MSPSLILIHILILHHHLSSSLTPTQTLSCSQSCSPLFWKDAIFSPLAGSNPQPLILLMTDKWSMEMRRVVQSFTNTHTNTHNYAHQAQKCTRRKHYNASTIIRRYHTHVAANWLWLTIFLKTFFSHLICVREKGSYNTGCCVLPVYVV